MDTGFVYFRILPTLESTFELRLETIDSAGDVIGRTLQTGYHSHDQALAGLVECLTTAPPDLAAIEETLAQVPQLMDHMTAANEAITQLGGRLNTVEDDLDALKPHVVRPAGSTLLPSRGSQHPAAKDAAGAQPAAPPPIRKRADPHQPGGGAFIPGQGDQ